MNNNEIPFEWYNTPGYYITYYGDVYHGIIKRLQSYFILPNAKFREFTSLSRSEQTYQKIKQFGWEIRDPKIIRKRLPNETDINTEQIDSGYRISNPQSWKKMFVFGAGASAFSVFGDQKDSFSDYSLRPPTGFEIFESKYESIYQNYAGVKLSIPNINSNDKNVEEALQSDWESLRHSYNYLLIKKHINILYYLQTLFHITSQKTIEKFYHNNLYQLLLHKLQKYCSNNYNDGKVSFVSFNNDTILDHFLQETFSLKFKKLSDYINHNENQVVLFKPHGSWNWGWKFRRDRLKVNSGVSLQQYFYNENITFDQLFYHYLGDVKDTIFQSSWGSEMELHPSKLGRFTLNKNLIQHIPENSNDSYFPAFLIPYRDKDELVMPYSHQTKLKGFLSNVEELYLIGWKGNERTFNYLLKMNANKLKKIIIVNPNPDEVKKNLKNNGIDIQDQSKYKVETSSDFEKFVRNDIEMHLNKDN